MALLGFARRASVPSMTAGSASAALSGGRGEAVTMLVRAAVLLVGAVGLLINEAVLDRSETQFVLAGTWHALAAVACLAIAWVLSRVADAARARRAALVFAGLDVVAYALYSLLFHDVVDAGTMYGIFVLLMPAIRWGWRGALASVPTVASIAVLFPQAQTSGGRLGVAQVLLLCLVFVMPSVAISDLVRHWYSRLRQAESLLAGAFAHASSGMALLDERGGFLQVNRALADLLAEDEAQLVGRPFLLSVLPEDRSAVAATLADLSPAHRGSRAEVRLQTAEGSTRWVLLAASWMDGSSTSPPCVLLQVENVTARKRVEQRLSHQATHDELTGLPNRMLLREHLDSGLARGERLAVLFLDLDRFKVVNDGLGHAAGDALLVEVASRLEATLRPGDLVARIGGDEFVLMARHVQGESDARLLGDRVQAVLRPPIRLERHDEVVSASIGIALSHAGSSADVLLRDADTAMYRAKAAGGGRSAAFTPDMREAAVSAHELEADLRTALTTGALSVDYQPAVDLVTGRVTGIEALARWRDEGRGMVSPTEFVAVAEQSELVCQLGWFVLATALRDAHRWRGDDGAWGPPVSVNISLRQLLEPDFAHRVAGLLDGAGVPPTALCLEVTETALTGDTEPVVAALRALRAVGVKLAIDDFGTGHASLTYLARFPVDVVKVDRSFVAGVGSDAGSAAIVGGVVAMAHAFGLRVVAEGPETPAQVALLRELGCDAAQGFAFARPMPAAQVTTMIERGPVGLVPLPRSPRPAAVTPDEARRYRLLLDGARDITACVDVESVLERAFVALRRVVSFTGGSIQLVSGDSIRLAATDPPAPPEALGVTLPLGQGVSGTMAVTGEPRYLPDITVASAAQRASGTASPGVRSWFGVPLVAEGRIIGVLQVDSTRLDAFDEQDRLLVLSFAPVVAAGVQHAQAWTRQLEAVTDRG